MVHTACHSSPIHGHHSRQWGHRQSFLISKFDMQGKSAHININTYSLGVENAVTQPGDTGVVSLPNVALNVPEFSRAG